jgi:pimeloyl-ACP methyl ester carboxylesterase
VVCGVGLAWLGAVKPAAAEDKKPAEPEETTLLTGDNLELAMTYYPGGKGKQTIPIVLLHGWKQSRNEFKGLAPALQKLGYAVVVPDLRGHGGSTRIKGARKEDSIDVAKMTTPAQFSRQSALMVTQDMVAVKDFLWDRNNAGELNIDKLCVVGAEMGASVALDFAAYDAVGYGKGTVFYGPLKLARFVKALVLISPKWSFPGLPLRPATGNPVVQSDVAMMILVGKQDPAALREAKNLYRAFEKFHPEPTGNDAQDIREKRTLWLIPLDTKLQDTKLLDPQFGVADNIAAFIYYRLVKSDESKDWTWKERKYPHG